MGQDRLADFNPKYVNIYLLQAWAAQKYMGVSKNKGTPKTPQNDHF